MKINIKTVAKEAGVSTATVSRVLADYIGVKDNTRAKVLGTIKDLKYEVDSVARSLRQRKTYTIGVMYSHHFTPSLQNLLKIKPVNPDIS